VSRRTRIAAFGAAGLLVAGGVIAAVIANNGSGQTVAFVLIGLGLVLATSLTFLEVGLSEDRERARQTRPPERRRPRLERPRLGRNRDHPRRLK
jgi:hypothetical protein